jgi:hypothetical protein
MPFRIAFGHGCNQSITFRPMLFCAARETGSVLLDFSTENATAILYSHRRCGQSWRFVPDRGRNPWRDRLERFTDM